MQGLWFCRSDIIKSIILDTSSILFGLSKRINIFDIAKEELPDHRIVISKGIIKELERLASTKKKNARDARTALLAIKAADLRIVADESNVDRWIIGEAVRTDAMVCTNDSRLKRTLLSRGVKAVSLGIGGSLR